MLKAIKQFFTRPLFAKKDQAIVENVAELDDEEALQYKGFFSTHAKIMPVNFRQWIDENAFRVKPEHLKVVNADGTMSAMDDSSGGMSSLKNAFNVGQYGNLSDNLFAWFVSQGFIGYQTCALIAQQWLVDKACSVAPSDAVRKGYDLSSTDDRENIADLITTLREKDKQFDISKNLVQFAKMNRVFGIRIALFHVDSTDPQYYENPFNIDGVTKGSYKGISQVDPMWITPELDADSAANTASKYFYEPTFWRINGKRYHRSHLVLIRYSEVPDVLKPSYIYGGIPLTQLIAERVYAAERTANEAPLLALTKRTTVLKTDMEGVLSNQADFEEKLLLWMHYRDNQGVKVIGEGEELQQVDTTLTDLDSVIMTQYQLVSAISRTPATKLLGTSPKGFGASGEYEESVYHEYLETIQNDELAPLLDRHYMLLSKSTFGEVIHLDIAWKPLDSMTETEMATVNFTKAQTDQILQLTGAVDGNDIRDRLLGDKFSGYNGVVVEELPEITELPDLVDMPTAQEQVAAPEVDVQKQSLNGAQVSSMIQIVESVVVGAIPRKSGIWMLVSAFNITEQEAESILADAGNGFKPTGEVPQTP